MTDLERVFLAMAVVVLTVTLVWDIPRGDRSGFAMLYTSLVGLGFLVYRGVLSFL